MASKKIPVEALSSNAAYQHVRLKLLSENMLGRSGGPKIIGLMSRTAKEGVSTTASGLALVSQLRAPGSVLLLDANPSEVRVSELLQCECKPLSSQVINEEEFNLNDYIIESNSGGLAVLTLAKISNGYTCSFAEFGGFWEQLKDRYETIIIDMGAWNTEAPLAWIEQVDDLILVLDGNNTTQEMLTHFKKTIDRCGCKLSGFIMNKHERPIPNFVYRMIT